MRNDRDRSMYPRYETGCEKIGEKCTATTKRHGIPLFRTKAKPLDGCTHRNRANSTTLFARAAQFLGHGTLWWNKGAANGPTAPLFVVRRRHLPPFIVATRQTFPFSCTPDTDLIGRRYCSAYQISRWIVIQIFRRLSSYLRNDEFVCDLRSWNYEYLFLFSVQEKRRLFLLSRRFFSFDRNIFQGERDGGKNLLGWRIVLGNDFFFLFSRLRGWSVARTDEMAAEDRPSFWSIEGASTLFDQKVVSSSRFREINERSSRN